MSFIWSDVKIPKPPTSTSSSTPKPPVPTTTAPSVPKPPTIGTPSTYQPSDPSKVRTVGMLGPSPSVIAGSVVGTTAPVPTPPAPTSTGLTDSQKSAQDWINNKDSGFGSVDQYTANQNQRYAEAMKSGNSDLINRLKDDAVRVGYDLNYKPIETSVVPAPPAPSSSTPYTMSQADLEAEAKARIDRLTADKERVAKQTKDSLTTNFNRLRDAVNQDRSLQDVTDQRSLSPFSGRSDYAQGIKALTRDKQDREYTSNYQTQLGNVDAQLNDWLNLAPEQQLQIQNELTRLERDYGLQVGSLMGTFGGQRTLAGSAQDANYTGYYGGQRTMQAQQQDFANQMAMAELMGTYNGQQTMAAKNQDWQNRFAYGQATGTFNNGQTTLAKQQMDSQNSQWEQKFNEDVRQFGLQYALQKWSAQQSASNAAADNARQNSALGLQQQQLDWARNPNNPDNLYKMSQISNNNPQSQMIEKAVSLAQKDPAFQDATDEVKRQIIQNYMNMLNVSGTGSAGVTDSDIAQYLK